MGGRNAPASYPTDRERSAAKVVPLILLGSVDDPGLDRRLEFLHVGVYREGPQAGRDLYGRLADDFLDVHDHILSSLSNMDRQAAESRSALGVDRFGCAEVRFKIRAVGHAAYGLAARV